MRAQVLPVVIGTLASVPKKLKMFLERMGILATAHEMQKSALLGSVAVIRRVLDAWGCWLWLDIMDSFTITFIMKCEQNNNNNIQIFIQDEDFSKSLLLPMCVLLKLNQHKIISSYLQFAIK